MQKTLIIFIVLSGVFFLVPAQAATSPWANAAHVQVRLISSNNQAVLEVKPEAGWHFYWRSPGDAGQAPRLGWAGSTNLDSGALQWPAPKRFSAGTLTGFGYDIDTLLPITLKAKASGQPMKLQAVLTILLCKDICVPQSLSLNLSVPLTADADASLIAAANAALPATADKPAVKIESTVVGPDAVVVRAYAEHGFKDADLFVEPSSLRVFSPPQITPDKDDPRHATLRIAKTNPVQNLARDAMNKTLILTLITKDGAVEKTVAF